MKKMKKQGKGKRKVKDYKKSIKNITADENNFGNIQIKRI